MTPDELATTVVSMRPFLPARDFKQSQDFYQVIGFRMLPIGDKLCHMQLGEGPGAFAFLLQDFYVKEFAENLMMHMMVRDLDAWWQHLAPLELDRRFGVRAPTPPEMQPWDMRVSYVFDPAGVLWHFAQD